jgi:GST-like protein
LELNPNAKVPVIVDAKAVVFESNAILLYLAEKTRTFLPPKSSVNCGQLLSWLMFTASGVGPFSGEVVQFKHLIAERVPYADNRYHFEAQRHYGLVDTHLATRHYMIGETYTIVDMAIWGWARLVPFILGDGAWDRFPNLKRLHDEIAARPAANRAVTLTDGRISNAAMDG